MAVNSVRVAADFTSRVGTLHPEAQVPPSNGSANYERPWGRPADARHNGPEASVEGVLSEPTHICYPTHNPSRAASRCGLPRAIRPRREAARLGWAVNSVRGAADFTSRVGTFHPEAQVRPSNGSAKYERPLGHPADARRNGLPGRRSRDPIANGCFHGGSNDGAVRRFVGSALDSHSASGRSLLVRAFLGC